MALLSPSIGWSHEPEENGIKELIREMQAPGPTVRGEAVFQLEKIRLKSHAAIPALIAILKDDKSFRYDRGYESGVCTVGYAAYEALSGIGLEAVPALMSTVASQNGESRQLAICAFIKLGRGARTSLDEISKISSIPNEDGTLGMLAALNEIDVEVSTAIPILEQYLRGARFGKESPLPGQAIGMFDKYFHHPRTLLALLSVLKNSIPDVRGRSSRGTCKASKSFRLNHRVDCASTAQRSRRNDHGTVGTLRLYGPTNQGQRQLNCFADKGFE